MTASYSRPPAAAVAASYQSGSTMAPISGDELAMSELCDVAHVDRSADSAHNDRAPS